MSAHNIPAPPAADNEYAPLAPAVVGHATSYGDATTAAPSGAPSSRNCTPSTPTSSDAVAVTVTDPLTVAPPAGAVNATVGAVVSVFDTVTLTADDTAVLPAASRATAVTE